MGKKTWTEKDRMLLRDMRTVGRKLPEIAKELKRSVVACREMIRKHYPHLRVFRKSLKGRDEEVRSALSNGATLIEAAKILGVCTTSVLKAKDRLGIKYERSLTKNKRISETLKKTLSKRKVVVSGIKIGDWVWYCNGPYGWRKYKVVKLPYSDDKSFRLDTCPPGGIHIGVYIYRPRHKIKTISEYKSMLKDRTIRDSTVHPL